MKNKPFVSYVVVHEKEEFYLWDEHNSRRFDTRTFGSRKTAQKALDSAGPIRSILIKSKFIQTRVH